MLEGTIGTGIACVITGPGHLLTSVITAIGVGVGAVPIDLAEVITDTVDGDALLLSVALGMSCQAYGIVCADIFSVASDGDALLIATVDMRDTTRGGTTIAVLRIPVIAFFGCQLIAISADWIARAVFALAARTLVIGGAFEHAEMIATIVVLRVAVIALLGLLIERAVAADARALAVRALAVGTLVVRCAFDVAILRTPVAVCEIPVIALLRLRIERAVAAGRAFAIHTLIARTVAVRLAFEVAIVRAAVAVFDVAVVTLLFASLDPIAADRIAHVA